MPPKIQKKKKINKEKKKSVHGINHIIIITCRADVLCGE